MKRVIAGILAVVALLLCGCSNKVDQAQAMLDAGDYQGAIEAADSALDEDINAELTVEAKEIKANAIYELQREAYEKGQWNKAIEYYEQMINEGENISFIQASQKLYVVTQAEQFIDAIRADIKNKLWNNVVNYASQINQLSNKEILSYDGYNEINIRMDEIEKDSREYLDIALENIEAERVAREKELKNTIRIDGVWTSEPDFLGGVKLYINFTNMSENTIKYITFGIQLYNAVGDIVKCQLTGSIPGDTYGCHYTGPCEKGDGLSGTDVYYGKYYNSSIDHAKLVSVDIEYMDGSTVSIDGDEINIIQY